MQLNYFGALKLILAFLPGMRERKSGHIINVSSIGVQTNTPRFSAYVASKAALDAFSRCVAPEVVGDGVQHHDDLHAARAHPDDRADEHLRRLPDAHAGRGRADALRRDDRQAEAQGLAAGHLRRGALRGVPEDRGHRAEHRLQPLPGLEGGEGRQEEEGQGRQGRRGRGRQEAEGEGAGDVNGGHRDGLPDARRALLERAVLSRRGLALALSTVATPPGAGTRPRASRGSARTAAS